MGVEMPREVLFDLVQQPRSALTGSAPLPGSLELST